jgi:hypothetical protein
MKPDGYAHLLETDERARDIIATRTTGSDRAGRPAIARRDLPGHSLVPATAGLARSAPGG